MAIIDSVMGWFKKTCRAYDAYNRYIGVDVVIFYEDVNRDRRLAIEYPIVGNRHRLLKRF